MIKPFCNRCNTELYAPGAIILISETTDFTKPWSAKKVHICNACEPSLLEWHAGLNHNTAFSPRMIVIITSPKGKDDVQLHYADASYVPFLGTWLKEPFTTLTTKYKELNPAKDYFKDGDVYRVFGSLVLERVPKDWPSDRPVAPNAKYYRPVEELAAAK